ncbi:MAG: ATP-dependent DNA helicase RecQ, partial [Oscillospiraceae bacterium]|nr:ATP-dependent DNA helicase RecQ [Oscillospiraceae bacterium]
RIRLLVERGYLRQSDGQYPTLSLAPAAREVLFHGEQVSMRLPRAKPAEAAPPVPGGNPADLLPARAGDEELFQELRALRSRLSAQRGVPPYVIFNDRSLREMCRQRPDSPAALLQVPGVGERKLEQFGEEFLEVIRRHSM